MSGILHRISQHFEAAAEERREHDASRQAYTDALHNLVQPGADVKALAAGLPAPAGLKPGELRSLDDQAFRTIAQGLLKDDHITQDEEDTLTAIGPALGVDSARFNHDFPDILERLVVARANDGRLPALAACSIILQKGEIAHLEASAQLLKWQAVREWKGGSSGFSFRVAKGVYYRTGRTRGHIVTTGQRLAPEDTGTLTVTSKRTVFSGSQKALQFAYPKLLDVQVYTDGIRLSVSNRQQPSTFHLTSPDAVAAVINAAAQKLS